MRRVSPMKGPYWMIELWIPVLALLLALLPYLAVDQAIRLMARRQRRESARTLERMIRQGDLPDACLLYTSRCV